MILELMPCFPSIKETIMLTEEEKKIEYLYKYRSLDDSAKGFTLELLRKNEFYLPDPTELNDPLDSLAEYEYGSKEEFLIWIEQLGLSKNEIQDIKYKAKECNYTFNKVFENRKKEGRGIKTLRVCCFSTVPDNSLLWSHYAYQHKGICIGFKTIIGYEAICLRLIDTEIPLKSIILKDIIPVLNVTYSDDMPKPYNLFNLADETIKKFLLTKASAWGYEKERRIILNTNIYDKKTITFNKKILSKIIFGLNTSESDKNEIYEIIKIHYSDEIKDIKFYQAVRIRNKYMLELRDLNI